MPMLFLRGAATESVTEWLQKYPDEATKIWGEAVVKNRTTAESVAYFFDRLGEITREGMYEGLVAAPFSLLGLGGRVRGYQMEQKAREFTAAHTEINSKLNETQIKGLSPEHTQEILEFSGMTESVFLPAAEVLTLHQSGVNLLPALSVSEEALTRAAAMGHDIEIPASRLHARLSQDDFAKVAEIMRSSADAPNIKEITERLEKFEGEQSQVMQTLSEYRAEETRYRGARDDLRRLTLEAIKGNPHLSAQVAAHAESPEVYVDSWLKLLEGFTERFARPGTDRAGLLRHLAVVSLHNKRARDAEGIAAQPATPLSDGNADIAATGARAAETGEVSSPQRFAEDDLAAFEAATWSDMALPGYELPALQTLAEDANGEARSIEQQYRDEMLDFQQAGMARPLSQRFEGMPAVEADSSQWFGEGKAIALPGKSKTPEQRKNLRDALKQWAKERFSKKTPVVNADTGWQVQVTPKGIEDSLSHGFDDLLARSVPFIPQIIESGIHVDSIPKTSRLMSHVFANKIRLDGKNYVVGFVLREDGNGNRFYDHELTAIIDSDRLAPVKQREATGELRTDQNTPTGTPGLLTNRGGVMNILREKLGVNDGSGRVLFQTARGALRTYDDRYINKQKSDAVLSKDKSLPQLARVLEQHRLSRKKILFDSDVVKPATDADTLHQAAKAPRIGGKGAARLQADIEAWERTVDGIVSAGKPPSGAVQMLTQTPLVMDLLGKDTVTGKAAVKGGIWAAPHLFDGTHSNITPDMWKQIPAAMADPIAIFDSDNPKGRASGDLVFMLELTDANGATVVVPVALDARGKLGARINIAKSAYAKESEGNPSNTWFIKQAKKNARYVNGQKWKQWSIGSGAASPLVASNASGNRIRSEADLVKLRNDNPGYYQGADHARGALRIYDDRYLVELMRGADLSTLPHETAHVFLEEFAHAVENNLADESMRADWDKLQAWLARYDADETLAAYYDANLAGSGRFGGKAYAELTADEKETARKIAKHEHFATGFEVYLMEGKAPSRDLVGVFQRFKDWLLAVYKKAERLGVELNDDVRGVFDRMIAAQEDVAAAAAASELHTLTNAQLDALNLTGPERAYASTLMEAAKAKASERLHRARERERRENIEEWKAAARDELRSNPVYQAREAMRREGGALDGDYILQEFGPEMVATIKRTVGKRALTESGAPGADPEIMAAQFGFASANDLLTQVTAAPAPRTAVKNIVSQKEAESAAAFDAATCLLETREAAEQIELTGKYLARNLGKESIQQKAFADVAARTLETMPMTKALQTGNFMGALRRALTEERRATARGDFAAALEANHKARLNMEFIRESRTLSERKRIAVNQVKRFVPMAQADAVARFTVMDIGHRHALCDFKAALAESKDPGSIRGWVDARIAEGYGLFLDDTVLYGPGKPWGEMTVNEFRALDETITQIVTVERNQRHILNEEKQRLVDEAVEELTSSIYRHHRQKPEKTVEEEHGALKALAGVNAVHTKTETLCVKLDGGKLLGPAWELIYRPINQAEDAQSARFKEVRDALRGKKLFGRYTKGELARDFFTKKVFVPEIGERITKETMLAAALNMGNADNLARLRDGHGWTDAQIAAVVKPLTKRDWDFVQAMWDYIGTFREESFALQEEITGLRPEAVEATPVQTPFGVYKGGYYPIRYNAEKSFKVFSQEQRGLDRELFGGRNYGAATTQKGHLKARGEFGLGTPLLLELSVATDHIFNVVHDIYFRKPVLDVAKIINHKAFRRAVETTVGRRHYRELMPWLQDVAGERAEPMHYIHRAMRWARSATSIMQMGYKATTIITQPFGFTQSIELLGYHYARRGLQS